MPLTDGQERWIASILEHMVDFSVSASELVRIANELNPLRFTHGPNFPFYSVQDCFLNPEQHFQSIENQQNELCTNIGDVQLYILVFLTEKLKAAAKAARMDFGDLGWNMDEIKKYIPAENFHTPFHSVTMRSSEELMLPNSENAIYTQCLYEHEDNAVLVVVVKYGSTSSEKIESFQLGSIPIPTSVESHNRFLKHLRIKAENRAMCYAARCALLKLLKYNILNADIILSAYRFDSSRRLITRKYYFEQILGKKLAIDAIMDLSAVETENLLDPSIIILLEQNLCAIETAKRLRTGEKKIVGHFIYQRLLLDGIISINEVMGISDLRSGFLALPLISHLIQNNKLSFELAKHLPLCLKKLFISSMYFNFFRTRAINWQALSKFESHHVELLLNKHFARLILDGNIKMEDVARTPRLTTTLLLQFPYFIHWLQCKLISIINLSECSPLSFLVLHNKVFAMRMYALFLKCPYKINDSVDTVLQLDKEIETFSANYEAAVTKDDVLQLFLMLLKTAFEQRLESLDANHPIANIYRQLCEPITAAQKDSSIDWQEVFITYVTLAKQIKDRWAKQKFVSHPIKPESFLTLESIFSSKRMPLFQSSSPVQEITTLCDNIIALSSPAPSRIAQEITFS